jgi:membrane dipeptidase
MMTRRQFTKRIGATAALAAAHPRSVWSVKASPAFSPIPDLTPAPVSPVAAELYRRALVLDANTLAGIGFPISDEYPAGVTNLIIGSGVNVVKATLGGAQGNFEQAVTAIAKAALLMEKKTDAFFKIDKVADFDRRQTRRQSRRDLFVRIGCDARR